MKPFRLGPAASAHLDMVRGVAAIEVMIWHLRAMFFVPYNAAVKPNLPSTIWYAITGFPHQAVMVFFVLSGLFIGPSVLDLIRSGRWSWKRFAVNRLSRLYIVLIPALLITAGFDWTGERLSGAQLSYFTALPYNASSVAANGGWQPFLGHLFFLESITCGTFGSDSPLWSLSYEFWYYALFPLIVLAWWPSGSPTKRIGCVCATVLVSWFIGRALLTAFPIWLVGMLVGELWARNPKPFRYAAWIVAGALAMFFVTLALSRRDMNDFLRDYSLALVTGFFFYTLLGTNGSIIARFPGMSYQKVAHFLGGFSYTIYLVHMPMVVLLRSLFIKGALWQPTPRRLLLILGLSLFTLTFCYLVSLGTERHTAKVRSWLLGSEQRA
jgi:peptidoglycan/LPS O-acetylase OafA/YrhL